MLLTNEVNFKASWFTCDLRSDSRTAQVLQSNFFFSCCAVTVISYLKLPHSQKEYSCTTATRWWKCLVKWHCDLRGFSPPQPKLAFLYSDLLMSASFRLHVSDADSWLSHFFLAFGICVSSYCPNKLELFDTCMFSTCTIHNLSTDNPFLLHSVYCDCEQNHSFNRCSSAVS